MSVVVPARNAGGTIGATIEALERQDLDAPYEVIVVDDGSRDGTATLAERAAGVAVLVRQDGLGPAAARNRGAAAARAPVLAFTDADCVPEPDWLREGLDAISGHDLVQGVVTPLEQVALHPLDRSLWITSETGLWESANLFVRRELFERIGGFQDWLDYGGAKSFGEDTWFGWRARRAGARTTFSTGAVVRHAVFARTFGQFVAEARRRKYFPAAVRQMPEFRDYVFLRWFLSRRTAAFDLALVAVAAAGWTRSAAPLAGVAPYALEVARRALPWRRRAPLMAAATVAADAVGFAALVEGSVRDRTLLL